MKGLELIDSYKGESWQERVSSKNSPTREMYSELSEKYKKANSRVEQKIVERSKPTPSEQPEGALPKPTFTEEAIFNCKYGRDKDVETSQSTNFTDMVLVVSTHRSSSNPIPIPSKSFNGIPCRNRRRASDKVKVQGNNNTEVRTGEGGTDRVNAAPQRITLDNVRRVHSAPAEVIYGFSIGS
jgi:hypothetical protein